MARQTGLVLFVSGLAALALAACDQPDQTGGTITGHASPCIGPPMPRRNLAALHYTITLQQGSRIISRQTLTGVGSAPYRFNVPAGHYRIKNFPGSIEVTVRPGRTTRANLYEPCS